MNLPPVYVMLGLPGSGKTTWVKQNVKGSALICSADNFRMRNGVYHFDPADSARCHGGCLKMFANNLGETPNGYPEWDAVVCDNTNTTITELAPYIALAMAHGHEVHPVLIEACTLQECAESNIHGVPYHVIEQMNHNLKSTVLNWPRHWPALRVQFEGWKVTADPSASQEPDFDALFDGS